MDKIRILELVVDELQSQLDIAVDSANAAHTTATHSESVAENKYDTFGLEASYLAQGQSERVDSLQSSLDIIKNLNIRNFASDDPVDIGALVGLEDAVGNLQYVFIAPSAGGIKVLINNVQVVVVTPEAPLGAALIGRYLDDEVGLGKTNETLKTIVFLC